MKSKKLKFSLPAVLFFASAVILVFSVFGDKGYVELKLLEAEERKLKSEIEKLEKDRLVWSEKIKSLKSDKGYYENLAREKLGLIRDNEIMIEIEYR